MKFVIRKNTKEPNHKNHDSFPAAAGRLSMTVKLNTSNGLALLTSGAGC